MPLSGSSTVPLYRENGAPLNALPLCVTDPKIKLRVWMAPSCRLTIPFYRFDRILPNPLTHVCTFALSYTARLDALVRLPLETIPPLFSRFSAVPFRRRTYSQRKTALRHSL